MLYTVAEDDWTPGSPLPASQARPGLYRTRSEAEAIAGGRRLLAVSVRYDGIRGLLIASLPCVNESSRSWSSPAIVGDAGGVTALAEIPAHLIRALGSCRLRIHAGHSDAALPRMIGRTGQIRSDFRR